MLILYNMLQVVFLVVFFPFLLIVAVSNSKYRSRILSRLGFGLRKKIASISPSTDKAPTIWIHALSVGETTSAEPLILGLRNRYENCRIIFSVTTKSGKAVADSIMTSQVDLVLDGPLDLLPVVRYFHAKIQPSLFILVETDFWPNNLLLLQKKKIPSILVNGRVSAKSISGYRRMAFFFRPMFQSFSALSMQTCEDKEKMQSLGIEPTRALTLGNLKFDTSEIRGNKGVAELQATLPKNKTIFICGSTHPGEEEPLIESYLEIRQEFPDIFLIIAPRNLKRVKEIIEIAKRQSLNVCLRTDNKRQDCDIFILDTIGELASCYSLAEITFVGGSLVSKGGHNPIEPAAMGKPVLFGPHMEDFSEIAQSLQQCGGASMVKNRTEISTTLRELLQSETLRKQQGLAAKNFVANHRGVIDRHLKLIQQLL
jgi:3-deoxy-D-manno-octulosonic-acid transferase